MRRRLCNGKNCIGPNQEWRTCNENKCKGFYRNLKLLGRKKVIILIKKYILKRTIRSCIQRLGFDRNE